ncbi:hypothetical protein ACQ4PT_045399 [Festuca glaucescens]
MRAAATKTETAMSAIQERLVQLNEMLGRIATRQDKMLVDLKKMTAAVTPTAATTPFSVPGRVPEQQATRPPSPSVISVNRAMAAAALRAEEVLTYATPTRYSTVGSAVNVGSNHVAVASPTSGTTHILATTSTDAWNNTLQGVVKSGANTPAGCSTHVLTGERAHDVNSDMPFAPPCQVVAHPAVQHPLLPQVSFPHFDGDNPRLWRHKCLEYFKLFNINECMWVTAATLHMEGAAAHWYKAYKLSQPVGDWSQFINAVEENFDHGDFGLMDVFPPETLVISEDKTNMDGDVCWTYNEPQDDFKTHDISEQKLKWCEASLRDATQMPETTVAGYEEVLRHVGGVSLFLEHFVQPTKVVFCELHSMEPEGEVFPTVGGMPLFLEEGLGSTNMCYAVLIKDVSGSDEVLTHVGGLSLFLECDLDLSVASVNQVLHDDLPWKYHAPFPWSHTRKGGILLLANMAQTTFPSGHNGMPSSYLVMDKCLPWSRSGFSPGLVALKPYSGTLIAPRNLSAATQDVREISMLLLHWHSTALKVQWFSLLVQLLLHVFNFGFRGRRETERRQVDICWFFKLTSYKTEHEVYATTITALLVKPGNEANMQVIATFSLLRQNETATGGRASRFPRSFLQGSRSLWPTEVKMSIYTKEAGNASLFLCQLLNVALKDGRAYVLEDPLQIPVAVTLHQTSASPSLIIWLFLSPAENAETGVNLTGTNLHNHGHEFYSNQRSKMHATKSNFLMCDLGDVHINTFSSRLFRVGPERPWDPGIISFHEQVVLDDLNAETGATMCDDMNKAMLEGKQCFLGAILSHPVP